MTDSGTIARVLAVIRLLSRSAGPLRVKAVAEALDLPMSTSHRYLDLLVEGGFVQKDKRHRYFVGAELLMTAKVIMERPSLISTAPSFLDEVNSTTGEAAVFNVYCRRHKAVSYVALARCEPPPAWTLTPDRRQPLTWGASGLAMLAFLPGRLQDNIIRLSEPCPTTGMVADRHAIVDKLNDVRARGYAVSEEEAIEGAAGIAVPILRCGEVAGSMGLIIPMCRFERRRCEDYGKLLKDAAQRAVTVAGSALS